MPGKHKYSAITPRLPVELKERVQRAASETGTDLNALVTSFLRWYVGDISELPDRPTPVGLHEGAHLMPQVIECKLCRVEVQKYPSLAKQISNPITTFMHPLEHFPQAYGRNVDRGHDVRCDYCERYGVNTGAKLKEHGLWFGWIDAETGVRLCCNEEPESHQSCSREKFHEESHKDANGNSWPQRHHFLLSRIQADGSMRHLDLYDTQANAQIAASYDIGGKTLEWMPREFGKYHGRLPDRVAYTVTYVDVGDVRSWLESAASPPSS